MVRLRGLRMSRRVAVYGKGRCGGAVQGSFRWTHVRVVLREVPAHLRIKIHIVVVGVVVSRKVHLEAWRGEGIGGKERGDGHGCGALVSARLASAKADHAPQRRLSLSPIML